MKLNSEESQIRFALSLSRDKPLVDAVLDAFEELERVRRNEHVAYKTELKQLREENQKYRDAYHDQWYNQREIERCWSVIGNYNRKHLELHEAVREYFRSCEWRYEEDYVPKSGPNLANYSTTLAKALNIEPSLAIKLVVQGIVSVDAMEGVEVVDLVRMGFSEADAISVTSAWIAARNKKCTCCRSGYEGHECPVHHN